SAQPAPMPRLGFVPIPLASQNDWVALSPDGRKAAIVRTTLSAEIPPFGSAVEIYRMSAVGTLESKLFEDKTPLQLITELRWVGEVLLYPTIQGVSTPQEYADWWSKDRPENGAGQFTGHVKVRMWKEGDKKASFLPNVKLMPPGVLIPGGEGSVLALDPLKLT